MNFITINEWPSSLIRGKDIANYLGAKHNQEVEPNETVISVKCMFDFPPNINYYIDAVDSAYFLQTVSERPRINIIAISPLAKQYISARVSNKVVVIPEYHCNFNNEVREDREVKVVGYVGSLDNLNLDVNHLGNELRRNGLELLVYKVETTNDGVRKDIVDFYKRIDIQIAFRKPFICEAMPPELKNPLKLENAGSFKIPTVCYPELNADYLMHNTFIPAYTECDVLRGCVGLKLQPSLYQDISEASYEASKPYSIEKIAELYKELEI